MQDGTPGETNQRFSGGFQDTTGFDAIGADLNTTNRAIDLRPDLLQVGKESPRRPVVRMTHMIPCHRFLTANFTHTCHTSFLQMQMNEINWC